MDGNKKYATVASFAAAEHGFMPGQLRTMTWKTLELVNQKDLDERKGYGLEWAKRCDAYWERQMRKFGVVVGDFTMVADMIDGTCFITTAATVLAVLPGDRV